MQGQSFIPELQFELISTIKCLERIPFDKFDWKPHEKSMSLGQLATHIAEIPGYAEMIMDTDGVDIAAGGYTPAVINSTSDLVQLLKNNMDKATEKLATVADFPMSQEWTLRKGTEVIFSLPRNATIRSMLISHMIHHRGQLSVYLRQLDIPVPSIYGPSADEAN
ncbi:MAG: hypothetical protein JWM96_569 [Alphaproteobacteria bacterium]|nr:hypothetical protein [Alphaproteobacteria bacterium]